MGSWNSTCGVTNLPIAEDERAVLIPLLMDGYERMAGGGTTEATALAHPIGLHMRGSYDTYGGLDIDSDSFGKEAFISWVNAKSRYGHILREGNPLKGKLDRSEFFGALERGEISHQGSQANPAFGFVLVREEVFDAVVAAAGEEEVSGYTANDGEWVSTPLVRRDLFKALLVPAEDKVAEIQELERKGESSEDTLRSIKALFLYEQAGRYLQELAPFASRYLVPATTDERVFTALNEFMLFRRGFELMRKTWLVPNGKTQTELGDTLSLYRAVAKTMLAAIEAEEADLEG